jgi:hypothetical protein
MISDKELDQILGSRYFKNHSETLVESIINKAYNTPQEKMNEFSAILRNIALPEPKLTLSLCLAASFLIGIFSNQTIEASLFSDVSEFMYYGGEIL